MTSGGEKVKRLLNLSSSWVGGGLKRLEETTKWFNRQEGKVNLSMTDQNT